MMFLRVEFGHDEIINVVHVGAGSPRPRLCPVQGYTAIFVIFGNHNYPIFLGHGDRAPTYQQFYIFPSPQNQEPLYPAKTATADVSSPSHCYSMDAWLAIPLQTHRHLPTKTQVA